MSAAPHEEGNNGGIVQGLPNGGDHTATMNAGVVQTTAYSDSNSNDGSKPDHKSNDHGPLPPVTVNPATLKPVATSAPCVGAACGGSNANTGPEQAAAAVRSEVFSWGWEAYVLVALLGGVGWGVVLF